MHWDEELGGNVGHVPRVLSGHPRQAGVRDRDRDRDRKRHKDKDRGRDRNREGDRYNGQGPKQWQPSAKCEA